MPSAKHLYFFTHTFPYGGESFVGNEIEALSRYYDKVFLFPSISGQIKDRLPSNVEVVSIKQENDSKFKLLLSNFWLILTVFSLDFLKNSDKKDVIRRFRYNLSVCLNTISIGKKIEKITENDNAEKRFVSFWMDQWALCLSVLKRKKKIKSFVFRVHQHDLYADGNMEYYIPFRFFNIKMASAVFPDSKRGVNFLKGLNFYPERVQIGHLGVSDKGTNPFNPANFVIVSCSALIERKRVNLIVEVLKLVDIPVTWIHFGAKGEDAGSFDQLKELCKTLPSNVNSILKGDVTYDALIDFYRTTPVSLFVTLTRAEGLPVSVIEAVSFGIPVLATDSMGLPDVVTEDSGILIPVDTPKDKIATLIREFKSGEKNTAFYREKVKNFWSGNFNSELNYNNFNTYITTLN